VITAGMGPEQRAEFMDELTEDDTSWEEQWERASAQLRG
jgi:hypothetical protein